MELLEIYLLNLLVTVGMFAVVIFRAWVELKNYRLIWEEMEWRKTYDTMGHVLRAEKELFTRVEGGDELYGLLLKMFKVEEE